jgi:hypothetical protein
MKHMPPRNITGKKKKKNMKREKWVLVRHSTGGGGTEFIIGFGCSQALPVCPSGKCKLLTGNIEV